MTPSLGDGAQVSGVQVAELATRMLDYLDRISPTLRRIGRSLKVLAMIGAVAGLVEVGILVASVWPPSAPSIVLLLVVAVAIGWAPVAVYFYGDAMASVAGLPGWLRSRPGAFTEHGAQLAGIYTDTAGKWGDDSKLGLIGSGLLRAGKVAWRVGKDIPEFAMATRVVNPALVFTSVLGVFWIFAIILMSPIVALIALF